MNNYISQNLNHIKDAFIKVCGGKHKQHISDVLDSMQVVLINDIENLKQDSVDYFETEEYQMLKNKFLSKLYNVDDLSTHIYELEQNDNDPLSCEELEYCKAILTSFDESVASSQNFIFRQESFSDEQFKELSKPIITFLNLFCHKYGNNIFNYTDRSELKPIFDFFNDMATNRESFMISEINNLLYEQPSLNTFLENYNGKRLDGLAYVAGDIKDYMSGLPIENSYLETKIKNEIFDISQKNIQTNFIPAYSTNTFSYNDNKLCGCLFISDDTNTPDHIIIRELAKLISSQILDNVNESHVIIKNGTSKELLLKDSEKHKFNLKKILLSTFRSKKVINPIFNDKEYLNYLQSIKNKNNRSSINETIIEYITKKVLAELKKVNVTLNNDSPFTSSHSLALPHIEKFFEKHHNMIMDIYFDQKDFTLDKILGEKQSKEFDNMIENKYKSGNMDHSKIIYELKNYILNKFNIEIMLTNITLKKFDEILIKNDLFRKIKNQIKNPFAITNLSEEAKKYILNNQELLKATEEIDEKFDKFKKDFS